MPLALPYNSDWRWLLDRNDSPWYPSMELFRQPQPQDLHSVFTIMSVDILTVLRYAKER